MPTTRLSFAAPGPRAGRPGDGVAGFARVGVFIAVMGSSLVRWEPAPVDLVLIVLIGLLPLAGLVALTHRIVLYGVLWLACGAGALVASGLSLEPARASLHSGVSLYLFAASVVLAAYIAAAPVRHGRLILDAWVGAALLAAAAGFAGYFGLFPGAGEVFTKFGRATGTFKDPNVLGAFLVPAVLWLVHVVLSRAPRHAVLPLAGAGVLSFAVLLSFSRGAWINLAVALTVYGYLAWVTAPTPAARTRITMLGAGAIAVIALAIGLASQSPAVADLLAERSSLAQGYDVGPEGRFGGQQKAADLVLASPLGIGAGAFAARHHHEDVHNVYLSMFLNAGWLGGLLYLFIVGMTVAAGTRHALRESRGRPMLLVAYAAFIGVVVEGAVIDTDHWRHFYLLIALVLGLIAAEDRSRAASRGTRA